MKKCLIWLFLLLLAMGCSTEDCPVCPEPEPAKMPPYMVLLEDWTQIKIKGGKGRYHISFESLVKNVGGETAKSCCGIFALADTSLTLYRNLLRYPCQPETIESQREGLLETIDYDTGYYGILFDQENPEPVLLIVMLPGGRGYALNMKPVYATISQTAKIAEPVWVKPRIEEVPDCIVERVLKANGLK